MISRMTVFDETTQSPAEILCKSCGLCCSGHLFIWVKLRPAELDPAETLGMQVFRDDPNQRGFSQPCPLWKGQCTIYASRHYPRACRAYNCKMLKEVLAENTPLPAALTAVERAKGMIQEMETLLPVSSNANFRERFVAYFEKSADAEFRRKANDLLEFYENVFGVKDLFD
jgi:hypothetical protein